MIPYVDIPDLPILGPIGIHPFGVMVAAAVTTGFSLARWRARSSGVAVADVDSLGIGHGSIWLTDYHGGTISRIDLSEALAHCAAR